MIRGAQGHQQTKERYAKEGKHDLINRLRILLMGLPHHILMTYLPVPTGDWMPPTPRRFTPVSEPYYKSDAALPALG